MQDQINPSHYKQYSIEVIEMMRKIWGDEAVAIHCELTAFKYRMRAGMKGEFAVCIEKEEWYINKAKEIRGDNKVSKCGDCNCLYSCAKDGFA